MFDKQGRDASPEKCVRGAHRFDLSVGWIQLLQCSAARELTVLPNAPECDLRSLQFVEIKYVAAFRRRSGLHSPHVFFEERYDFLAFEIVYSDFHCPISLRKCESEFIRKSAEPVSTHSDCVRKVSFQCVLRSIEQRGAFYEYSLINFQSGDPQVGSLCRNPSIHLMHLWPRSTGLQYIIGQPPTRQFTFSRSHTLTASSDTLPCPNERWIQI